MGAVTNIRDAHHAGEPFGTDLTPAIVRALDELRTDREAIALAKIVTAARGARPDKDWYAIFDIEALARERFEDIVIEHARYEEIDEGLLGSTDSLIAELAGADR